MICASEFLAIPLAYYTIKRTGVVTRVFYGHCLMACLWAGIGVCTIYKYETAAIFQMMLYMTTFALSDGPSYFMYNAEVSNDS